MKRITAGPNSNVQISNYPAYFPESRTPSQTQQQEFVQSVRFRTYQVTPVPGQPRFYKVLLPSGELPQSEEREAIKLPDRQAIALKAMPLTATPEAESVSRPESEPPDAASIDFPRGFTDHLLRKPPGQTVDEFFMECYPYSCGLCKHSFAEGEMLMKHMLNKHETADERLRQNYPYLCDFCDSQYSQPDWLQQHVAKNHMNQALEVEERCYLSFCGVASALQDSNNQPD